VPGIWQGIAWEFRNAVLNELTVLALFMTIDYKKDVMCKELIIPNSLWLSWTTLLLIVE
jgi:hypothetical protein